MHTLTFLYCTFDVPLLDSWYLIAGKSYTEVLAEQIQWYRDMIAIYKDITE